MLIDCDTGADVRSPHAAVLRIVNKINPGQYGRGGGGGGGRDDTFDPSPLPSFIAVRGGGGGGGNSPPEASSLHACYILYCIAGRVDTYIESEKRNARMHQCSKFYKCHTGTQYYSIIVYMQL